METESGRTLYLFLVQTIEQACTMSPAAGGAPAPVPAAGLDEMVAADFSGPTNGRVLLGMSGRLLARITDGFLDGHEALDHDNQLDALKELVNILCGNLLPYVGGSRAVFKIDVPRCLAREDWAQKPGERLFGEASASYEGGDIFLRVLLEKSSS